MRRRYVTVSEGTEAATAEPLVTIDCPQVAAQVAALIAARLGITIPAARSSARPTVVALAAKPDSGGER